MKSILLSIRPEWTARILNGEKTIEVRRKFPKDYQGWVYIYCTKNLKSAKQCLIIKDSLKKFIKETDITYYGKPILGKVCGRFWCDKVEETFYQEAQYDEQLERILKDSCLTDDQLWEYADNDIFYAVHISKLEIFDRPKELSEFYKINKKIITHQGNYWKTLITKAPQNYCFIEGEE